MSISGCSDRISLITPTNPTSAWCHPRIRHPQPVAVPRTALPWGSLPGGPLAARSQLPPFGNPSLVSNNPPNHDVALGRNNVRRWLPTRRALGTEGCGKGQSRSRGRDSMRRSPAGPGVQPKPVEYLACKLPTRAFQNAPGFLEPCSDLGFLIWSSFVIAHHSRQSMKTQRCRPAIRC